VFSLEPRCHGLRGLAEQIGFSTFLHFRQPAPLDNQPVIRQNQDTLYSTAILDLSSPATVTLPDAGGRYMLLHVVNQDHYMFVLTEPGDHALTEEIVGTRYVGLNVRTFMDPTDPAILPLQTRLRTAFVLLAEARDLMKRHEAVCEHGSLG